MTSGSIQLLLGADGGARLPGPGVRGLLPLTLGAECQEPRDGLARDECILVRYLKLNIICIISLVISRIQYNTEIYLIKVQ